MPPAILTAALRYKADLAAREAVAMRSMASRWLQVTRGLEGEIDDLARIMAARRAAGQSVTAGYLYRTERYQQLLQQSYAQFIRYEDFAADLIARNTATFARLGREYGLGLLDVLEPGIGGGFNRLNVGAIENIAGFVERGPLRALLADAWPHAIEQTTSALVRGVALGYGPRKIAKMMVEGMNGGLQRALVISRTESMRAYRTTKMETWREFGIRGWQRVGTHDRRTCPACLFEDGKFYPQQADFQAHPQCVVEGTTVSTPRVLSTSHRRYDGFVFDIVTANGNRLTVTPNHPVLTDKGWVAAHLLNEGDSVISSRDGNGATLFVAPDNQHGPTAIENIVAAFCESSEMLPVSVPVAAEDFHGDGLSSDVAVIRANRFLQSDLDATLQEPLRESPFGNGCMGGFGLFGQGRSALLFDGFCDTHRGILGDSDAASMFLDGRLGSKQSIGFDLISQGNSMFYQAQTDNASGYTIGHSQSVFGLVSQIAGNNITGGKFNNPLIPVYASFGEMAIQGSSADVVSFQNDIRSNASEIILDRIVNLTGRQFSGHVYNLQTETGWYVANGIITHNCRCTLIPVTKNGELHQWQYGPEWYEQQPASTQVAILGPGRHAAWKAGKFDLRDVPAVQANDTWGPSLRARGLAELTGQGRGVGRVVAPPVVPEQPPEWRPSMSRAEAERWAANSQYKDDVYHITPGVANERSIKANGFNLDAQKFGRMWGDGVYVGADQETADVYRQWTGRSARTLTIKVNVEKPYVYREVYSNFKQNDIVREAFGLPDNASGRTRAVAMIRDNPKGLTGVLSDAGYDALRIIPRDSNVSRVGGNQLVVFDPKKVVVIND